MSKGVAMELGIMIKRKHCMQCSFYYLLKHLGAVSSMITYMHISDNVNGQTTTNFCFDILLQN